MDRAAGAKRDVVDVGEVGGVGEGWGSVSEQDKCVNVRGDGVAQISAQHCHMQSTHSLNPHVLSAVSCGMQVIHSKA